MDGLADAEVSGAAAEIAGHRLVDIGVCWLLYLRKQCGGGHDLAGLAVTALGDVELTPGLLQRMIARGRLARAPGRRLSRDTPAGSW